MGLGLRVERKPFCRTSIGIGEDEPTTDTGSDSVHGSSGTDVKNLWRW